MKKKRYIFTDLLCKQNIYFLVEILKKSNQIKRKLEYLIYVSIAAHQNAAEHTNDNKIIHTVKLINSLMLN